MAKKSPVVSALDIKPDEIYLVMKSLGNGDRALRPCRVRCTETTGWLRGQVEVDVDRSYAYAHVVFVEDATCAKVPLFRSLATESNPWVFQVSAVYKNPTLHLMPSDWIEQHIRHLKEKAADIRAQLEANTLAQAEYLTLKQKMETPTNDVHFD
jgi:hypothetical protein